MLRVTPAPFEALLFSTDPSLIRETVRAGVGGVIVDWERRGKAARQVNADTQINGDTLADLRRVRAATDARVLCRINCFGPWTAQEIDRAVAAGADEIILPMVRTPAELSATRGHVAGRCGLGILIETDAAVARLAELLDARQEPPLTRVYVGLNDLAIDRGHTDIFTSVADGTVARVRAACSVAFGFGGLTVPDRGSPIPSRLLIGEMVRLECRFSFLRRSFHRDIAGRDPGTEVMRLLEAVAAAAVRSRDEVARDQAELLARIAAGVPVVEHSAAARG